MGFESTESKGSTFWVEIEFDTPVESIDVVDGQQAMDTPPRSQSNKTPILLAEDNEINRLVAIETLQDLGHSVDFVVNGKDAVVAWEQGNYSLTLMDIQMPEMDGIEATRQIREKETIKNARAIRIVAVTANAYESDREDCLAAGMDDYLSKPFSDEQFHTIIERWVPQTNANTGSVA